MRRKIETFRFEVYFMLILLFIIVSLITILVSKQQIVIIDSKINTIFELITALGTLFAVIVATYSANAAKKTVENSNSQLKIIEKQFQDQYKPDFKIDNSKLQVIFDSDLGYGSYTKYTGNRKLPNLLMTNIGEGYAKKIIINYEFDLKKSVSFLRGFTIGTDKIHQFIDGEVFNTEFAQGNQLDKDLNRTIEFGDKFASIEIPIPISYLEIISMYNHLYFENESIEITAPPLHITINYLDRFSNLYYQEFLIKSIVSEQGSSFEDQRIKSYRYTINFDVEEKNVTIQ